MMSQTTDYQRQLAERLIESDDFEDAIDFARENQWEGVLNWLLVLRREKNQFDS